MRALFDGVADHALLRRFRCPECGCVLEHGALNPDLVIVSDDAGQFDILVHALCWIHAERSIRKLVGFNDAQREAVAEVRSKVWEFYRDLRAYKQKPHSRKRAALGRRCRDTFASLKRTCRKLGIGFWEYLNDRVCGADTIPWLPDLLNQRLAPPLE